MDAFRWSLLLIGLVVIGAIYGWEVWRRRAVARETLPDDILPEDTGTVGGDDDWEVIPLLRHAVRGSPMDPAQLRELTGFNGRAAKTPLADEDALESLGPLPTTESEATPPSPPQEELLVLSVLAPRGEVFTGPTLSELFEQLDLRFGDMRIFHRLDDASGESVYSVVSIVEPGHFDLETLHELRTPGLALFMRLPGPVAGVAAFEDMYAAAQTLAVALEGGVADQQRRLLSEESLAQLRAQAARFQAI